MAWIIKNHALYETTGELICTFPEDLDPYYSTLIKNSEDVLSLFFTFLDKYEADKKMPKKLYDKLSNLIEEDRNYDFRWTLTRKGVLIDGLNNIICSFSESDQFDAILIQYVPEILFEVKHYLATSTSGNNKTKTLYERLKRIRQKINEY